ncbi:cytochrome c oxidase subunit IV-domain-containing protein [Irpex rosettiformis]|uniref:Cytochrome c oxidase subunit IV-domain-containing protein n=1 Tax=Irpex rosettiformis TaxID=378272 RepID=A0ACB8TWH8_9APHY|nr:cytochrome c oxidase subunit IV-domain-containing protein [Irpex rosettiformis]
MQALRLARPHLALRTANVSGARWISATASQASAASLHPAANASAIPLSNVEAQWERLSADEQLTVHQQLEEIQKKDWKTLSIDEKKAAYYVAFGPHGPRAPINPPGTTLKIAIWVTGFVGLGTALYVAARNLAQPPPKTISKEWEEASNERALEQKMDPISGIASKGYSGKGFVTHK